MVHQQIAIRMPKGVGRGVLSIMYQLRDETGRGAIRPQPVFVVKVPNAATLAPRRVRDSKHSHGRCARFQTLTRWRDVAARVLSKCQTAALRLQQQPAFVSTHWVAWLTHLGRIRCARLACQREAGQAHREWFGYVELELLF